MFEALVAGTIAVVATALAWAIAYRVGPAGTRRHRAALLVTSVVIFTVASAMLMPHARAWKQEREVDALLRENPVFAAALEEDPSLRGPLRESALGGLRGGGSDEAVAAGLRLLSPRLWRSVAGASDAAAVGLGRALVATLTDLQVRDPQQCYRFLFPAAGAGGGAPRDERLLRALGAAALSARGGSAEPLDRRAAAKRLEKAYGRLRGRHGGDVDVLKNAQAPGVDRSRVCAMTIALYAELVALPPDAAGQALRHVLGPAPPAAVPPPPSPAEAPSPPPAS
jgi:hypothetical protein